MNIASTDPGHLLPEMDRLRARVRADQRSTSAPMLVFGALIVVYALIVAPYTGRLPGWLPPVAFAALGLALVAGGLATARRERAGQPRDSV